MCLMLKLLQLQPEKEIIVEFIKNEDYKYVRILGWEPAVAPLLANDLVSSAEVNAKHSLPQYLAHAAADNVQCQQQEIDLQAAHRI